MNINDLMLQLKSWLRSAGDQPQGIAEKRLEADCFIVDDEQDVLDLISRVLSSVGLRTRVFLTADALMQGLKAGYPRLIFLDVSLDRSDAVEVLNDLQSVGYGGQIILMSGHHGKLLDEINSIGHNCALKMLAPVLKPFDIASLRSIAMSALQVKPSIPTITIEQALSKGWMRVWYQPKINLRARKLVGCEALVRIQHPTHGTILPGKFLPGATSENMYLLTRFVLQTVMKDCNRFWDARAPFRPAINVPVDVLLNYPIAALVRENCPSGEKWNGLIIEVTEDQIIQDVQRAQTIATQLKIYGISLSIDDFGTGYSSLARLKHFPFAELKLDMSFVRDCADNVQNAAICKAAIGLAHGFGATVVAEGIETAKELRKLYELGCDLGQGHLFAAPMPSDKFMELIKTRSSPHQKVA